LSRKRLVVSSGRCLLAGVIRGRRRRNRLRFFLLLGFPEGGQFGERAQGSRAGQGILRQLGLGRLTAWFAGRLRRLWSWPTIGTATAGLSSLCAPLSALRHRSAGASTARRQRTTTAWRPLLLLLGPTACRPLTAFPLFAASFARVRPLLRRFSFGTGRDHRQRNTMPFLVHRQHPHRHHITDRHHIVGAFDVAIGHLANVNEAAILQADIDEGAEIDDVEDGAL